MALTIEHRAELRQKTMQASIEAAQVARSRQQSAGLSELRRQVTGESCTTSVSSAAREEGPYYSKYTRVIEPERGEGLGFYRNYWRGKVHGPRGVKTRYLEIDIPQRNESRLSNSSSIAHIDKSRRTPPPAPPRGYSKAVDRISKGSRWFGPSFFDGAAYTRSSLTHIEGSELSPERTERINNTYDSIYRPLTQEEKQMVPVGKPRKYASVRLASGHRKAPPVVIRPAVTAVLNATVKPAGEDNEAATEVAERSASAAAGSFTETTKAEERTPLIPLATAWSFQARSRTDDTGYGERLVRLRASASDNRLHRLKLDRYDRRGKGLLGGHPGTILPPKTRPAPRRPASASAKSLPSRDKPLTAASLAAFNEQQDKAAGVEPTPPATPIVSQNMFTLVKPPPSGTFGTSPRKDEPPPPGSPHSKRPNSASPHSGRAMRYPAVRYHPKQLSYKPTCCGSLVGQQTVAAVNKIQERTLAREFAERKKYEPPLPPQEAIQPRPAFPMDESATALSDVAGEYEANMEVARLLTSMLALTGPADAFAVAIETLRGKASSMALKMADERLSELRAEEEPPLVQAKLEALDEEEVRVRVIWTPTRTRGDRIVCIPYPCVARLRLRAK